MGPIKREAAVFCHVPSCQPNHAIHSITAYEMGNARRDLILIAPGSKGLMYFFVHSMVVVRTKFACVLIVVEWLKSNHLTAKIWIFAPLPTSTKPYQARVPCQK